MGSFTAYHNYTAQTDHRRLRGMHCMHKPLWPFHGSHFTSAYLSSFCGNHEQQALMQNTLEWMKLYSHCLIDVHFFLLQKIRCVRVVRMQVLLITAQSGGCPQCPKTGGVHSVRRREGKCPRGKVFRRKCPTHSVCDPLQNCPVYWRGSGPPPNT